MHAVTSSFLTSLALVVSVGLTGCDHKEPRTDNPAQAAWVTSDATMARRMSELRDRQKLLSGRAAALAVPEGTADTALATIIGDVAGRLGAIDAACNAADAALVQARADATSALAQADRLGAERTVRAGVGRFEQAAVAADKTMNEYEPTVLQGESIMNRLMARIAAEVARLQRLANEGGNIDFSEIDFKVGSADFDFTNPASKATLERLAKFGDTCPELRFGLTGHTSKEGNPAKNRALSLARADAVKGYLVAQGVDAAKVVRTAGLGSTKTLVDEPDPGTPAEAAMDPGQLEQVRVRNRRVNVDVVTPCGSAAAPTEAAPKP